ncbi:uncharacterized protein LOC135400187 [Ornithodoros turicata]|uniref:uncharacterized protein LOC135400187 n=1 Tax=Ornithodoros turicata TaxID=34597 RepID=UPI0031386267
MTRVPFGASSSPFLLAATLRHHLAGAADRYPDTTERLKHGFYVDDLIVGATSDDDAFRLYQDAVSILAEAGMELRKWASNSPTMNSQFLHDGLAYVDSAYDQGARTPLASTHRRNHLRRRFGRRVHRRSPCHQEDHSPRTSPHLRPPGSLGYGWDAPLAPQQRSGWTEWCSQLPTLNTIRLARHLTTVCDLANSSGELHVFADASPRAYGAALYLRTIASQGQWNCSLLISKGRVAPLKTISLPRLELIGCLTAARLAAHIRQLPLLTSLPSYFWTDSTIALHWITADLSSKPAFVQHRVTEIKRLSAGHTWRHCPGQENPADLVTRGVSAQRLAAEPLWWHGPHWLTMQADSWPSRPSSSFTPVPQEEERVTQTTVCPAPALRLPAIFDLDRYGNPSTVLRITAWVRRFVANARHTASPVRGPLTARELDQAEIYWLRRFSASARRAARLIISHQTLPTYTGR